ncbi:hypothetical protein A0J48_008500 [Sphaerospermopsis aphanizomenoides BCCUSP55]|uniref:hypothetical protein n=1 Tax=Sphaerospermopsis aphanizomenoides TaxID=459663 RepID=UPI0019053ED1|nr:hypothetical protein [Sphaerospermopsis aphanizomenoides]MBK1987576.1 hypothetical protein [Sphaerospermopsis aphanizomenoides BCCUSP55]
MNFPKYMQLFGTVCSGLLMSLPVIPQAVLAQQTTSKVNPCPGIFYEEPYNIKVIVPAICPPNDLTLILMQLGLLPVPATPSPYQRNLGVGGEAPSPSALNPNPGIFQESPYNRSQRGSQSGDNAQIVPTLPSPSSSLQPPAPEQRQNPSARIALSNGKANIKLINNTGAKVTYQVIGDTAPRILEGKSDVTLRGLSTPVTVTFQREDRGLLRVTPKAAGEQGTLEVTLQETTDVNQDRGAMSIQSNGAVFLN